MKIIKVSNTQAETCTNFLWVNLSTESTACNIVHNDHRQCYHMQPHSNIFLLEYVYFHMLNLNMYS